MNHIYRVVFNKSTNTYQAVAEITKGHTKTHSSKARKSRSKPNLSLKPLTIFIAMLSSTVAIGAPTGGVVSAGDASIAQQGSTTIINQTSQNAAINWQSFDIKPSETVDFQQPNVNAITLNRVLGNERTVVNGAINANGQVFIQNPNGALIGKNAQINVGGLVATTAEISDADFMAGNFKFAGEAGGLIENLGTITVPEGGVVALIAPIVKNEGQIVAPKANVLLASAESFSITFPNSSFSYTLDKGTLEGLVDNGGAILADGGYVVLTTLGIDSVKKSVLSHTGIIEANTVQSNNGVIELLGDLDNSELQLSGTIKAEAIDNDDGGFVETSASELNITDSALVSTKAESGETGTWLIDPKDFVVASSGGDITGQQVSTALNSNNVTLKSTNGQTEGKGDVIVDDTINWDKNTLTLSAQNDIHINRTMNGSGTAKLAFEYGQNTINNEADYYLDKDTPLKDRDVQVNLPEGKRFSIKHGNSEAVIYDVIHKMPDVYADGTTAEFRSNNIAVGQDIDLTEVGNAKFLGWDTPVESFSFNGMGHKLDNFNINFRESSIDKNRVKIAWHNFDFSSNYAQFIGLFREVNESGGKLEGIRDLDINNANINVVLKDSDSSSESKYNNKDFVNTSDISVLNVGVLAGYGRLKAKEILINNSNIETLTNNGIKKEIFSLEIPNFVSAGLILGEGDIQLKNTHTSGSISSTSTDDRLSFTGGIIGFKVHSNVHSKGSLTALRFVNLGKSDSYIIGSSSDANIKSYNKLDKANLDHNEFGSSTGGLAGHFEGKIHSSFFNGSVEGITNVGGLIGSAISPPQDYGEPTIIEESLSQADITGLKNIGGIIGLQYYDESYTNGREVILRNLYSESQLKGESNVGGIIGRSMHSRIYNSYSNSSFIKTLDSVNIGGVIGYLPNSAGSLEYVFYNEDLNHNITSAIGNSNTANLSKNTSELKQKSTFKNWDFEKIWRIDEGNDYPRLQALTEATIVIDPTELGIKANDLRKTYDGNVINSQADLQKLEGWNNTGINTTGLLDNDTLDNTDVFTGELRFDGDGSTWQGAKDAGKYIIVPTGLGSQKYEIKWGEGNLTINPASLVLTGTRRYDGTTTVNASEVSKIVGIVTGDENLTIKGTGTLKNKDIGSQTLASNNFNIEGAPAKNYVIDNDGSTWIIDKALVVIDPTDSELGITANTLLKTYDGNSVDTQADLEMLDGWDGTGVTANGLLDGDTLDDSSVFTGILRFDGAGSNWQGAKNAGIYTIVPTGLNSDKYEIKWADGKLILSPAVLVLTGKRTYDGTNQVNATDRNQVQIEGIVGDDALELEIIGTGTIASKNIGTHRLISDDFRVTEPHADNYIVDTDASSWQIDKAMIHAHGVKTYDSLLNAKAEDIVRESLNIFAKDDVKIIGEGRLRSRHVGTSVLPNHTFELIGSDIENYTLDSKVEWEVTPKQVDIKAEYDDKLYDGTTISSKQPFIDGVLGLDTIIAKQEFVSPKAGGMYEAEIKPVVLSIKDGNNGNNYRIQTYTTNGTILDSKYEHLLAPELPENDEFKHLNDSNVVFAGYTREKLNSMTKIELLNLQQDLLAVLFDDADFQRKRNVIKTLNKTDLLHRHEMAELYGLKVPVPLLGDFYFGGVGGSFGQSDFEALFSKKGLAFTLKTASNIVNAITTISTGGTLDIDSVNSTNINDTLKKIATFGSQAEINRFIDTLSGVLSESEQDTIRNAIFSGIPDNEYKDVTEIVFKLVSQPVDTILTGNNYSNQFTLKMTGLLVDLAGEFIPPGHGRATVKTIGILFDQYDNAKELSDYSTELFNALSKPISEYYRIEIDKVRKDQFIENIMILQDVNNGSFR